MRRKTAFCVQSQKGQQDSFWKHKQLDKETITPHFPMLHGYFYPHGWQNYQWSMINYQ
jgi:hypothetical protein